MECYTPATMLQHASRTAEAAEVAISIRPCHATRFWCEKMFHLLHQRLFYPGITYSLTSELWPFGPAEAARVGGGDQHLFYPGITYSLTSELWSSGPAEAARVGGGGPFTP